jgi:hypothetical protein
MMINRTLVPKTYLELPEVEKLLLNIQMDAIKHLLLPALETL